MTDELKEEVERLAKEPSSLYCTVKFVNATPTGSAQGSHPYWLIYLCRRNLEYSQKWR